MVVSYLQLYYQVLWNPGYLPLGEQKVADDENAKQSKRHRGKKRTRKPDPEKTNQADADVERGSNSTAVGTAFQSDFGLESFYTRDVFVCQEDGRPHWCTTCCQYKTDRAHHCRELGRCVRKMDHFCPWYDDNTLPQAQYPADRMQGWRRGVGDIVQILHSIRCLYLHILYLCTHSVCLFYSGDPTPGKPSTSRCVNSPICLLLTLQPDRRSKPPLVCLHWTVSAPTGY
jgi:hypothetical protein